VSCVELVTVKLFYTQAVTVLRLPLYRSSNGNKSTGKVAVAIRAGEARIPEGAEAWSQCGGGVWPTDVSDTTN
jgi:hypothetical protein